MKMEFYVLVFAFTLAEQKSANQSELPTTSCDNREKYANICGLQYYGRRSDSETLLYGIWSDSEIKCFKSRLYLWIP